MIRLFRVSELLENIKITLSENFPIVDVQGEISDVNVNSKSGHIYFNLKEDKNVISCACWKNNAPKLQRLIIEGKQVKLRGRVLSYPTNSKFYINVANIQEDGVGIAQQNLLILKEKLNSEGLFLDIHKKPISKYPKSIGLITSSDGDVINDIKTTLKATYPTKLYLYDVPVQGEDSVSKIVEAIKYFNDLKENIPDFLIIARGGGSAEDLFHFNNEALVRTIFKSKIPIITAIGHDPDSSLADLVADKYAATPTASVAFLGNNLELRENIKILTEHSEYLLGRNFSYLEKNLINTSKLLKTPSLIIKNQETKVDYLLTKLEGLAWQLNNSLSSKAQKLEFMLERQKQVLNHNFVNYSLAIEGFSSKVNNFTNNVKDCEQRLFYLSRMLNTLSFKETLKRGFSVVSQNGKIVKSSKNLKATEGFEIEFFDGKREVK
ncbi:MAG: exodeoxyribonuclease VII large subunit [Alphaproteobacteria bacterium]|jgi:exodeoxyribonuclease VII large subunit|nr:exodeoxyribonuclease VII large subunit [Alphaproteobacteria bacterium]